MHNETENTVQNDEKTNKNAQNFENTVQNEAEPKQQEIVEEIDYSKYECLTGSGAFTNWITGLRCSRI